MNQDSTVQKKQYLSEKKNSCRGVHLKKKKIPAQAVSEKTNSWKLKTAPPPSNQFSNGPSLKRIN